MPFDIRLIQPEDNTAAANLIKDVLAEFGYTGPGYASSDPEMADLYSAYQNPGCGYWVVIQIESQKLIGSGGFSPLKGALPAEGICELQKYYLYPEARGLGLGKKLLSIALQEATCLGYREMYLESLPGFSQAISLYQKMGFQRLRCHKGNTGHQARCSIFMSCSLQN